MSWQQTVGIILIGGIFLTNCTGVSLGRPKTKRFCRGFLEACKESNITINCKHMWYLFEQAYKKENRCQFYERHYDALMNDRLFNHSCYKTVLWSNTSDLVHNFTKNKDCFTLEDTWLGSFLHKKKWCGKENSDETYCKPCQGCSGCNNSRVRSFWRTASAEFAAYACGEVKVMLSGDLEEPFDLNSNFASIEVKRLHYPKVTRLSIVLLTDKDNVKKCNENESLQKLKKELDEKEICYSCKEVTRSHIRKCIKENNTCGACW